MRRLALLASIVLASSLAFAAPPPAPTPGAQMRHPGGPGMMGPMDRNLFPPDLLLTNQIALGLSADQITAIKKLVNETHGRVLDVQTDLNRVTEQLHDAIEPPRVDEAAALGFAGQAMDLEKQIKTAHLTLMIRTKNLLTPEQQDKARALMPQERYEMRHGPDGD